MKTIKDIMVCDVICVKDTDNVHQARMILKDRKIRHLPVVDSDTGDFAGVLTQRSLLNNAFNIVEKFGMSTLGKRQLRTAVKEVMNADCTAVPPDMDLITAGEYFTVKKSSCLLVVENNKLLGLVTSVDFVKLALHLLK